MHPRVRQFIAYSISLLLATLLLWYVFSEIQPGQLLASFKEADYRWILLSSFFSCIAYWSRAQRWCLLMKPLHYTPGVVHSFLALMSGYFVNLFLPRVGEVTRCGVIHKLDKVPINVSFGTVVAERIFDVIMLFILLCFTLAIEFERFKSILVDFLQARFTWVTDHWQANKTGVYGWILVAFIVVSLIAALLFFFRKSIRTSRMYLKMKDFFKGMAEGLLSVRKIDNFWAFLFHTVLIWVMYYLMSYVLFFAMPQTSHLGIKAGFTILIMGGLGMSAPVQGGFGTFHWLVGSALVLYGLNKEDGYILATFMHASQTLFTLLTGGISLLIVMFIQRKKPVVEVNS